MLPNSTGLVSPNLVERELIRYLRLSLMLRRPITMFSEYIDNFWHAILENPKFYRKWCIKNFGLYIGHVPSGENPPVVYIDWIKDYEKEYGRLPNEWFANINGTIKKELKLRYMEGAKIWASWQCSPIIPDEDGNDS